MSNGSDGSETRRHVVMRSVRRWAARIWWVGLGALACDLAHVAFATPVETWCGLAVEPENRCSPYDRRRDYTYPRSIEWDIVAALTNGRNQADADGNLRQPFPSEYQHGVKFTSIRQTDIEHRVPAAEAHDSGLCRAAPATRTRFARDLTNLTLAAPTLNRHRKSDKDPAEWMPAKAPVAYALLWVQTKLDYGLSIDAAERDALADVLGGILPCASQPPASQTE